jgi:hypothetical protein
MQLTLSAVSLIIASAVAQSTEEKWPKIENELFGVNFFQQSPPVWASDASSLAASFRRTYEYKNPPIFNPAGITRRERNHVFKVVVRSTGRTASDVFQTSTLTGDPMNSHLYFMKRATSVTDKKNYFLYKVLDINESNFPYHWNLHFVNGTVQSFYKPPLANMSTWEYVPNPSGAVIAEVDCVYLNGQFERNVPIPCTASFLQVDTGKKVQSKPFSFQALNDDIQNPIPNNEHVTLFDYAKVRWVDDARLIVSGLNTSVVLNAGTGAVTATTFDTCRGAATSSTKYTKAGKLELKVPFAGPRYFEKGAVPLASKRFNCV